VTGQVKYFRTEFYNLILEAEPINLTRILEAKIATPGIIPHLNTSWSNRT